MLKDTQYILNYYSISYSFEYDSLRIEGGYLLYKKTHPEGWVPYILNRSLLQMLAFRLEWLHTKY